MLLFSISITISIHRITENLILLTTCELGTEKINCKTRYSVSESFFTKSSRSSGRTDVLGWIF